MYRLPAVTHQLHKDPPLVSAINHAPLLQVLARNHTVETISKASKLSGEACQLNHDTATTV